MATYGFDLYGLTKYGPNLYTPPGGTTDESFSPFLVEYSVLPFVAVPVDYDRIRLTWQLPESSYDRARLVRSRFGFPISETDGETLLDSSYIPAGFEDTNVQSGRYYFYSIFLHAQPDNVWVRAGVTSTMMVAYQGFGQQMYDMLPNYIKYGGRELTLATEDNPSLVRLMWVFGWALDHLKTHYNYLGRLHTVDNLSVPHLQQLSAELGIDLEEAVSLRLARQRVKNQAVISREKGTRGGLRNLINAATGWDADITVGNNLLLDNDQASFIHPVYADWSPFINYPAGERAKYLHYAYEATPASLVIPKDDGAYGEAQKPTGSATSNIYWTFLGDTDVTYPLWSEFSTYAPGRYVEHENKLYRSMLTTLGSVPADNETQTLDTPVLNTPVTATTGGTLGAAKTYSYRITALNAVGGETLASPAKTIVTGTGKTNKVTLTWAAVPGAVGYRVYGRTLGSENQMDYTTATTYVDAGQVKKASGSVPAFNTTECPFWRFVSDTLRNKETGGVYTWEGMYANGNRLTDPVAAVRLVSGKAPPGDPSAVYANAMFIQNNTGVTADLALRSVARRVGPPISIATDTTGGILLASTVYSYRISVLTTDGTESTTGPTKTITTGAGTTTNRVRLAWPTMPNAVGYKVYGRTGGSEQLIATLGDENTYTDTGDVTPSGAPVTTLDPRQPINDGIPLPIITQDYDSTKQYFRGDLVRFQGRPYRARRESKNATPPTGTSFATPTAEWEAIGYDDRIRYVMSGYLAPRTAGAGFTSPWTAPNVTPFVEWYDSRGKLITALDAKASNTYKFDTFGDGADWNSRSVEVGGGTWQEDIGQWKSVGWKNGVAVPIIVPGVRNIATIAGGLTGTVAATFRSAPTASGVVQGVVFRVYDFNNYWRATRTGLDLKVGGVVTNSWTYTGGVVFQDNDRITVKYNQTPGNIKVYRHGVEILSVTNTSLATNSRCGMVVE